MDRDRIHRTTSADGTEIAGRVHGQGPPLVLVHGAFEDGDTCWEALLPRLSGRFTCHAMSLRGRGLSGHSTDLTKPRLVEDVIAYVDSLGEPVALMGESGGGFSALGAAARSEAVSGVAVYEPIVFETQSEEVAATFADTVARARHAAEDGGYAEAIGIFASWIANEEEVEALSASEEGVEALGANVPVQLEEFRQLDDSDGPSPTGPSELARISAPVLIMHGSRTALRDWIMDGARHVAEHVPNSEVREMSGAGHFGIALAPDPIADEVVGFLAAVRN